MAGIFSKPKRPRIPQAPELPKADKSAEKARTAAQKRKQANLARGRQSTILSKSAEGFEGGAIPVKKTTMGGG